ncbi:MAG: 3-keto-5-aminohexanoate cleavage protein [Clostridiales bacterium]|nr:3-keto-5-aminohexanoate cleavage protein [Clostridiales bacterium]
MAKTIITAAMTGAVTPAGYNIPEKPADIAAQVYECWKLGASVCHLHMRDDNGMGVMDPVKFFETIKAIRSYKDCDIIINCTSSGDNRVSDDSPYGNACRTIHHRIVPGIEMGTFDAGSFNWGVPGGVFHNSPNMLMALGKLYQEKGIKPEFEIFDFGMLRASGAYWQQGYVVEPLHFQFCLGVMGGMDATTKCLQVLIDEMHELQTAGKLPKNCTWSAFGTGKGHLPVMFASIANGGHIRVGMEDNVVYGTDKDGKKIMATNMMLVERAANAVRAFGNDVATSAEARQMLSIPPLDHDAVIKALNAITYEFLEAEKEKLKALGTTYTVEKGMGGK